jgi:Ca-activated chloride channel family protein
MRSAASPPKRSAANPVKRAVVAGAANARTSGDSTTEAAMKWIHYSRYTGEDLGIGAEDLLQALSDFLLESGFNTQYMPFSEWNQHTLEDLKKAIQQALEQGKLFDDERLQEMMERLRQMTPEQMDKLLENLVQKMVDEGQITIEEPNDQRASAAGVGNGKDTKVKFEVTDKSLDFLGFKTLRDLLGSLGKSSFGRHDTRDLATGIEASGSSKQYEFGDTLNLDITETLFSAIRREGVKVPLDMDYSDLRVHQCEYQSSCATVLMLDCSHSMILYGEDRFTPAKKVALALSHLIRKQYPGDSLRCVLFHDSAEELAISQLARVQVGPYYTNTRDGLILAQRLLNQEKKDMRQIIMITDGKPSCLTLEDGRMYKNAFGLDPLVISRTLEEVNRCKKQGIIINTFMLASDYGLVNFVQKVTELCRGKAYFTTPFTLGQYLLMDYMNRKTRTIH